MDTIFDLPTHPLAIHAPIVLLPIVAIVALAMAVRPSLARRLRWYLVGSLVAVFAMLLVARQSGQELDQAFGGIVDVSEHAELADQTTIITALWMVVAAATALVLQFGRRPASLSAAAAPAATVERVLPIVGAVLGILATIWLIRTGHEGAYSHWKPVTDTYFR